MKQVLLFLHRWVAVIFSIPLTVLILTGLILSFEPIAHLTAGRAVESGLLTAILKKHDPNDTAKRLVYRNYDGSVELDFATKPPIIVDVASNEVRPARGSLARLFETARALHQTLMLDLRWLVIASTAAMAALVLAGILMGLPRRSWSLGGWHRVSAWVALPMLVMLPVTGLLMSFGITLNGVSMSRPPNAPPMPPVSVARAVRQAGNDGLLQDMVWLRAGSPRPMLRHMEGVGFQGYFVMANRSMTAPRNWPRALHEGLWIGAWSCLLNALASLVLLGLLVTGLLLWLRRRGSPAPDTR
ncbi:MAG: PepSY domain-containing protein [Acetobacteraceae bacterium]